MEYPFTALTTCRGCNHNCKFCGGSNYAYRRFLNREKTSFKSPEKLVDEIKIVSEYFKAPIFLIGDIRQGGMNYAQTVLTALREVEDTLVREDLLQRRLNALRLRFSQAIAAEKLAKERYLRGVEQLITVLESARRRRIAEDQLNSVKGELWTGRVDLFLALDGDHRQDPDRRDDHYHLDQRKAGLAQFATLGRPVPLLERMAQRVEPFIFLILNSLVASR